jgi:hypothetical protein
MVLHYFYFIVLLLSFPSQARTSTSHDLVCAAIVASEDSHATVQFFSDRPMSFAGFILLRRGPIRLMVSAAAADTDADLL